MKRIRWGDILTEVVADWIARVLYFLGTVAAIVVAYLLGAAVISRGRGNFLLNSFEHYEWQAWIFSAVLQPAFWVFACVLGILAAILGPGTYRRRWQRGLGKLDEIRVESEVDSGEGIVLTLPSRKSKEE